MHVFKEKKLTILGVLGFATLATNAAAHPGAHVHPHDGAHWLVLVSALGLVAIAGGLAAARVRSRK